MHAEFFAPINGFSLFGALMICLLILTNANVVGEKLGIMDYPDAVRKRHSQVTPLVGGLAIMLPLVAWVAGSVILNRPLNTHLLLAVALCGAGATLIGYADDQSSTSPSSRLLALVLFAVVAMVIDPELIPKTINWGSFAPTEVPIWFGCVFIAVAMAGFVNAVNMADGQNGLVLGMYLIWATCLMITTRGTTAVVSQVLFETVFVTFLFNMTGRTFIGDSGSYGISFVFGLLVIRAHNVWHVSAETIAVWFSIPVLDCLRLIISRALQGQVPSDADRDHFHHRLQDRVGPHAGLAIYLGVVGSSSLIASFLPHLSLLCLVVIVGFYFSFAWLAKADSDEARATAPDAAGQAGTEPGHGAVHVLKFDAKDGTSR